MSTNSARSFMGSGYLHWIRPSERGGRSPIAVLFYLFAAMAAGSAIGVVISRNIVRTAVCLLFTLIGRGGAVLPAQRRVPRGGAARGLRRRHADPDHLRRDADEQSTLSAASSPSAGKSWSRLGLACCSWRRPDRRRFCARGFAAPSVDAERRAYPIDTLGQALLGDYLVPFELVSVLLLVVMIGAAYLAKGRAERERGRELSIAIGLTTLPDPRGGPVRLRPADDPAQAQRHRHPDGRRADPQRRQREPGRVQPLSARRQRRHVHWTGRSSRSS